MYCTVCGQQNAADARFCTNCGQQLSPQAAPPPQQPPSGSYPTPQYGIPPYAPPGRRPVNIPNYLVQAILVTILGFLCCGLLPVIPGVVSIVYATQVNSKVERGDIGGASRDSQKAKMWAWIAFGVAWASALIWVVIYFLVIAAFVAVV
jgi:hypothetical protein